MADGDKLVSIANARGLGIEAFTQRVGMHTTHDNEATPARIQRRMQRWTPTEIHYKKLCAGSEGKLVRRGWVFEVDSGMPSANA